MIQNLADKAIQYLKENYILPKYGILAGGSLANLIWEYKTGNKAVINDIDIFVFQNSITIEDTYPKREFGNYSKKSGLTVENITHPYDDMVKKNKDSFYQIVSTEQIDNINYIYYDSNKKEISNVINSFDFNCTQIGYDLETDNFLWTKEFEEFINTGKILCTNLQSPSHSIVRLPKKCEDLNIEVPKNELYLLYYSIISNLSDMNKRYFTNKYMNLYNKYEYILKDYVFAERAKFVEDYLFEEKKLNMEVYALMPNNKNGLFKSFSINKQDTKFRSYYDLLFYWRHIKDYPNRKINWYLHAISDYNIEYFDEEADLFDIEIVKDYYYFDKNKTLVGKSIKEQAIYLKKLESKIGKQKTKLVLQNVKANNLNPDDDTDLTIMELCIRKLTYNNNLNIINHDIF